MSNQELVHAYRHLLRWSLRAVQFSKPARFVVRDTLRAAFRDKNGTFEPSRVKSTLWFLESAATYIQNKSTGPWRIRAQTLSKSQHVRSPGSSGQERFEAGLSASILYAIFGMPPSSRSTDGKKEAITRGQTESDESAPIVVITPQIGDTFAHRRIFPQVSPHLIFDDSGVNGGLRSCHWGGQPCPTSEAQEDAVDAHSYALPSSNFWASDDGGLRAVNQKREGQQL
ncbi:hypothetical protein NEUTE1DRAFT_130509 [Neurospora tetrasperma FGSC 2508]|uniref:DUF1763-domain-containing protein n=1 Tax=Neurospora tetrasperma (strain FGSC 2508 / ATCC MYA-4615 / P0657) TaxID=510951 RepID=F8MQH7_NEUT8|nr:uncharacterized protein NEUTE1DRAFT_130509 [Neurospora tetrasperma FGSC 2508]EGO56607.1 hypothetical protein NEUTE1DRAFT_130509 [Neurospora tetrasperma FGSC 2508]EGZ70522.1 DUF1763-domain-containing protein [Neurospora tetrasperma FGSC 2509]